MNVKLDSIPTLQWVYDGEDWVAQIIPKTSWYRINTWDGNYELWLAEADVDHQAHYMFVGDFSNLDEAKAAAKTHIGDD